MTLDSEVFAYTNVRPTLTRLDDGRSLQDLACATLARTHEAEGALGASFFVQPYLPTTGDRKSEV